MPDLIVCSTKDTRSDRIIQFGWMVEGQERKIRKRIFNESYTETMYNVDMMVYVDDNNIDLLKHGSLFVRPWNTEDWIVWYKNVIDIGTLGPRESFIFDMKLEIPPSISRKKLYYIPLVARYI